MLLSTISLSPLRSSSCNCSQLASVRDTIKHGVNPEMIQTGSSGSYFIRACYTVECHLAPAPCSAETVRESVKGGRVKTVAVFKPNDEEPYGNLNPKRVFLRRYLWWAMGRPCLIPSFSYLSEVGASLLDDRLQLSLVPSTRLVELSSSVFSYTSQERQRGVFREKVGSYQNFLYGYVNVSTFLRAHPWPSRPRNLLEQDLQAENHAHGRAKARAHKGKGASRPSRTRGCLSTLRRLNCCASSSDPNLSEGQPDEAEISTQVVDDQSAFFWTKELMQDFRLELEKLVCFDYLMRNTDRGLDNFMVKVEQLNPSLEHPSGWKLTLAAIDNSLAFPWKHPAGIRSYPWGWLYLPTDLIGGNFSPATRKAFIPLLSSASWWNETRQELEGLFRKDDHFEEKKFQGQMDVLRGQGWNLLESLRSEEEGPLELCARQKQMVTQEPSIVEEHALERLAGTRLPLTPAAQTIDRQLKLQGVLSGNNPAIASAALPRAIPSQGGDLAPNSANDAIQPRSLPETIDEEQISHRWNQASAIDGVGAWSSSRHARGQGQPKSNVREVEALGKAYRGKSLGIDVLAEIDKSASRSKRPRMRKAFTGNSSSSRAIKGKTVSRREEELASEGSEREEIMADSVASLPGTTSPPPTPSLPFHKASRRRRNGSVGDNWSISSVLDRRSSNENNAEEQVRRMQVVVEVRLRGMGRFLCSTDRSPFAATRARRWHRMADVAWAAVTVPPFPVALAVSPCLRPIPLNQHPTDRLSKLFSAFLA